MNPIATLEICVTHAKQKLARLKEELRREKHRTKCIVCKEWFMPNQPAKYCSNACRQQAYRNRGNM